MNVLKLINSIAGYLFSVIKPLAFFKLTINSKSLSLFQLVLSHQKSDMNQNQTKQRKYASYNHFFQQELFQPPRLKRQEVTKAKERIKKNRHLQDYKMIVGLLQAKWYLPNTKTVTKIHNTTAFAISPNIIVTSIFNLFSKQRDSFADLIEFVPDLNPSSHYRISRKYKAKMFDRKVDMTKVRFELGPVKQALAFLYLNQPLQFANHLKFPALGTLHMIKFNKINDRLHIIGYQNYGMTYYQVQKDLNAEAERFVGTFYNLRDTKLYYRIRSQSGFEGCPIFGVNSNRQTTVVGMHMYQRDYVQFYKIGIQNQQRVQSLVNLGLYFTTQILEMIKQVEIKMKQKYKISKSITFYDQLRPIEPNTPQSILLQRQNESESSSSLSSQSSQEMVNKNSKPQLICNYQDFKSDCQQQSQSSFENTSKISLGSFLSRRSELSLRSIRSIDSKSDKSSEIEQKQNLVVSFIYQSQIKQYESEKKINQELSL